MNISKRLDQLVELQALLTRCEERPIGVTGTDLREMRKERDDLKNEIIAEMQRLQVLRDCTARILPH